MQDFNEQPVFSSAEVQQLRSILRDTIFDLESDANDFKQFAQYLKRQGANTDLVGINWKMYWNTRAKIKKIAALQVKLKSVDVLY